MMKKSFLFVFGLILLVGCTGITGKSTGVCVANLTCSEWSACEDGIQTRSCVDSNNCGSTTNKPITGKPCGEAEAYKLNLCGDGSCSEEENCDSCPNDCLNEGDFCCNGEVISGLPSYTQWCCTDNVCIEEFGSVHACINHTCRWMGSDGVCNASLDENPLNSPDCRAEDEVACGDTLYKGDCCKDYHCSFGICQNHYCITEYASVDWNTFQSYFWSKSTYTNLQKENMIETNKGKWINGTGIVNVVDKSKSLFGLTKEKYYVKLMDPSNQYSSFAELYFEYNYKNKEDLLDLSKYDEISFICKIEKEGMFIDVILQECEII